MSLTGEGASTFRSSLEQGGALALPLSSLSVPVVRRYKYLGTLLDDSSTFRSEVLFRASSARKASFRA
eukprot:7353988-Prorocentrum_lima.AAC.1